MEKIVYVGLDVHADTIAVAIADDGRNREIRFHGVIENTADSVLGLTKRLVAANTQPIFCYEAGPCGYGLHRLLTKLACYLESLSVWSVCARRRTPHRPGTGQTFASAWRKLQELVAS